ncbi:DUF1330 domain-containing protein [Endozoicomonadaceae bacterium StTr2]
MQGYWIAFVDIHDAQGYQHYLNAAPQVLARYGARILARGSENITPLEGFDSQPDRMVVLEFDSYQKALDCYHSDEYQAACKLRQGAATARVAIMEGLPG